MSSSIASKIVRIHPQQTALFVCDIQERFANAIYSFESVVKTANKMIKAASILKLPVYTTEQAPKGEQREMNLLRLWDRH